MQTDDPSNRCLQSMLMDTLRCVICNTVTADTIQCFNCHSHCSMCIDGIRRQHVASRLIPCAICRSNKGWSSTRRYAELSECIGMKIECGIEGCDMLHSISEIDDHRSVCPRRRFECPLSCDCEPMRLSELVAHLRVHGSRVRTITSHDCLNIIVSEATSRVHIFLFENLVVFMHTFIRLCSLDSVCVEMHAGVIGSPGYKPNIRMNVNMYDLCTSNMTKLSAELQAVEDISHVKKVHRIHSYDNFVNESASLETVFMDNQWTRADFLKKCGKVYASDQDVETTRASALVFQFERIAP